MTRFQPLVILLATALLASLSMARPFTAPPPMLNEPKSCSSKLASWASIACDVEPQKARGSLGSGACDQATWNGWAQLPAGQCLAKCETYYSIACASLNKSKSLNCYLTPKGACWQGPYGPEISDYKSTP